MLKLFTRGLLLLTLCMLVHEVRAEAIYRVTFLGSWTSADLARPSDHPISAHFTALVGATHTPEFTLWSTGQLASSGVRDVAELGSNFRLFNELATARSSFDVGPDILIDSLFNLPNSASTQVTFTDERPLISLISMIAPSSDWFVGVSGLNLKPEGLWLQDLTVDLRPYDAGTEEGSSFSLSNPATSPAQPISRIQGFPFKEQTPILGTLRFELLNSPNTGAAGPSSPAPDISAIYNLLLDD